MARYAPAFVTDTGRVRARLALGVVLAAVVIELVRVHGGVAGSELAGSWQLLDLAILEDEPLRGVWYLHTQPPLHNLVVGLVAWSPLPFAGTIFVLFVASLGVIGFGLLDLLLRWRVPVVGAVVTAGLAVADPALLSTIRTGSYEVPLASLLVGLLVVLDRHLRRPTSRSLAAVVALGTALVLTRALFHPAWLAGVVLVVLVARPPARRQVAVAIAVPAVLVGGIAVKNELLVDSLSLSSWTGFNVQRGVLGPLPADTVDEAIDAGAVTDLAAQAPWQPLTAYAPWLDGCRPGNDHAALAAPLKVVRGIEIPNFNHACYVGLYDESRANAVTMIRREPAHYLGDRVLALGLSHAYTPLGHDDPGSSLLGDRLPATTWMDRLFSVLMVRSTIDVEMGAWNVPLYGETLPVRIAWPLVLATTVVLVRAVASGWRCWRSRRSGMATCDVLWLVAGFTVAFVVIVGDLVELGENGRFRAMVDPVLFAAVAVTAADLVRRRRADD